MLNLRGGRITEKRFTETISTGIVTDNVTGKEYKCEMRIDKEFLDLVNALDEENTHLKKIINFDGLKYGDVTDLKLANEIIDSQRETIKEIQELNIPMKEIKETVKDYKGRTIGVYYND